MAGTIAITPAYKDFASKNTAALGGFFTSLNTFSTEALSNLSDVSKAPSAPALKTSSDALIAAIDPATTDPDLQLILGTATALSKAIAAGPAADVSSLLALQSHTADLTALAAALTAK